MEKSYEELVAQLKPLVLKLPLREGNFFDDGIFFN